MAIVKNDVGWIKKILSPVTLILAIGAVIEIIVRLLGK
jgi:hypothetical protein